MHPFTDRLPSGQKPSQLTIPQNPESNEQMKRSLALLALVSSFPIGCSDSSSSTPSDPQGATGTTSQTSDGAASTGAASVTTGGTTGGGGQCLTGAAADGSLLLLANVANNYSFASTVTLNLLPVAPNTALDFDWSGLSRDLLGHDIDPAQDVVTVILALLQLTPEEFEAKLAANERVNSYSKGALAFYPDQITAANMYEFTAPGNTEPLASEEIDPYLDPARYDPATHTFAVLVQDSTDPAKGVRMVQALRLDPDSFTTEVVINNDSATLGYTTDLTAVVPVAVPPSTPDITVDWADMEVNGLAGPWEARSIDEVMIGHYSLTPAELTSQFLDLELVADALYRGPVPAGDALNVSTLMDEAGQTFPGIDDTGTWVLALNCGDCTNPAPWFLTILVPCNG